MSGPEDFGPEDITSETAGPEPLQESAETLVRWAGLLGFDRAAVAGWEQFGRIYYEDPELETERVLQLTAENLSELAGCFGRALTCRFSQHEEDRGNMEQLPAVLEVRPGLGAAELARFKEQVADTVQIAFLLRIDKGQMLAGAGFSAENCNLYLYLFPEALDRFLGLTAPAGTPRLAMLNLQALEKGLWPGDDRRKAVLLLPGRDVWLDGDYLALVGGPQLAHWRQVVPVGGPDAGRPDTLYQQRLESATWDDKWLDYMTPAHLHVSVPEAMAPEAGVRDPLQDALNQHLVNLIILYTANRTEIYEGQWRSTYADGNRLARVLLRSPAELAIDPQRLTQAGALYELFSWAYDSRWPTQQISFLQRSVTQELARKPAAFAYDTLLSQAGSMFEDLDRRWDSFIAHKFEAYTAEERALEDYVNETVDAFAGQVSAMIKSVSDTMLAAIAALLGSFIAAGFGQNQFDETVFSVGMVVYALYVLAFPLAYNMSNQWTRYRALEESVGANRDRFIGQLGEERVDELVEGRLARSQRRFRLWFAVTVGVYLVAIALGLAASAVVPDLVGATTP